MKNKNYQERVFKVTQLIPRGRVSTYGLIANYLDLGSARMVGWALNKSPSPTMMQELLESEGVEIKDSKVQDFKQLRWDPSIELDE